MIAELVARLVSTSALAGTRASLTLLCLGLAGRFELLAAPHPWMTSNVGLGVLLALVIVEELAEQDEDLQALFDMVAYALRGGAGALAAGTIQASASGAGLEIPQWGAAMVGAGLAVGTHHLRAQLHQQLVGAGEGVLSPRTWLAWLELGGVLGLMVAIVLAPILALGFVVVASLAGVGVIVAKRALEDRVWRRACDGCGARVRVEARRCPGCRQAVEVARWRG
ncbi:hypothetical protein DB30_03801 [Enhygromyxa salina]|uniref:DUF4126 domain-containing protein n=1 Tax=Enhygromyxa salina TaxID=215803 RepID=A0A0C2DCW4_9BACT|nr:DUF4126 family protein [Enhygromyxa salina]KIG19245.1 hypothetical protein DB30_03801 [Enhygromyxa salina]